MANTAESFEYEFEPRHVFIACISQAVLTCSASSVAQPAAAAVATYPEKAAYHHRCSSGKRRLDYLQTENWD